MKRFKYLVAVVLSLVLFAPFVDAATGLGSTATASAPTPRTTVDGQEIAYRAKLNAVARRLNERPRKTLNFQTPAEMLSQCVASTG